MHEKARKRIWLRLDNAAKIFPASLRSDWSNVFRVSVSFQEEIDPCVLDRALQITCPRFPSVCVRLCRGMFWYYLEENARPPRIREEGCQPLLPMQKKEIFQCALRVLYYKNRLAVECFHALTDGSGAMVFLKTLAAVYLELKKGIVIPKENGILDPKTLPEKEELEDAFLRYAGKNAAKREGSKAYRLTGTPEPDGFLHVTCATLSAGEALSLAKKKGVTLTAFLSACLTASIARIQKEKTDQEEPVRIQIPVNLRKFFPSRTVRNFVAVFNVGLEKGESDFVFDEILQRIHHQMALSITPRNLQSIFTANVNSEKGMAIRLVPLFLKNIVMRAVFDRVGESSACLCLSNLGKIEVPKEMQPYILRFDFIIGPQAKAPYNCGVCSYGDTLSVNVVRNTKEPELEQKLFPLLSSLGLTITLESNER